MEHSSKPDAIGQLPLSLGTLPPAVTRLYLAFSGGVDSAVLLDLLLPHRHDFQLVLWHVNHGLQDFAPRMEAFTREQATKYSLQIRVDRLELEPGKGNVEARARQARYDLFAEALTSSDALLTAHHANDQAETLLLNLMRGSGPAGLRGIAGIRPLGEGVLCRPLLHHTRPAIIEYARQHGIVWFEDPTNCTIEFDRNFLRHEVVPILKSRWPGVIQQLHRVCGWQEETQQLLDELAQQDLQQSAQVRPLNPYPCLSIPSVAQMSDARVKNLVRFWIRQHNLPVINHRKLQELLREMRANATSALVVEGHGYSLRGFQKYLYLVDNLPPVLLQTDYIFDQSPMLEVPEIGFKEYRVAILRRFGLKDDGQSIALRFRAYDDGSGDFKHRLKRMFQRQHVPPWQRAYVPQVYCDRELVGLWLL